MQARQHGGAPEIALIGNPNTGKSTLFNRLTGIHQRTGNYPGVTVDKHIGTMRLDGAEVTVIDLPGTYTLAAASADERIVIDVLNGRVPGTRKPDAVVVVADATNLMRNLFLASQVADVGLPMVLVLNMVDQADRQGIVIDAEGLSRKLGIPVVKTVAAENRGIDELRRAVTQALTERQRFAPVPWPGAVEQAMRAVRDSVIEDTGHEPNPAEVQRLLFDTHSAVAERLGWNENAHREVLDRARGMLVEGALNPLSAESVLRYRQIGALLEGVVRQPGRPKAGRSESVDKVLTHKFWGLFIFAGLMWLVFQSIYTWAGPVMDLIETAFGWLGETVGVWLASTPILQSLVVDGMIAGVGGVLVFLPQILILFFFVSLLEDTGYMARAAFLVDRLFRWCGLNGRSFVPLLGSYACAVPGIMAARTIEDNKARLTTILIAPLMSCAARLPVYVLMIELLIRPRYGAGWAAFCLFAMHVVGLVVALPIAWVINKWLLRATPQPFAMEMPRYRVPKVRDVLWRMWNKGMDFVKTAGTIIFAMSIVIWALSYFPRPEQVEVAASKTYIEQQSAERSVSQDALLQQIEAEPEGELGAALSNAVEGAYIEQSYLGRAGKTIQPIFAPAGYDWKITVGVLGSFPAREVIISTLGIVYNIGGDVDEGSVDLKQTLAKATWPDGRPVFTIPVAFSIMVFFALCLQCGATVATIVREAGVKWAVFSFVYMSVLAWAGAVATYQVGSLIIG